ncbi:pseudouridine synthase family protein isoform X2 [Tasmannia lanceolata]|uniref:pseudouridine synthase family protein isoform X2 n=1 Tax=Tasmannia lanceolata TaxID=3420 RepID=UPI0040639DA3
MLMCVRGKIFTTGERIRSPAMENQTREKVYLHYNHTDSCKYARWTARECYEFMYGRPWQQVLDFYSSIVNGHFSLSSLFCTERHFSRETSIQNGAYNLEECEETKLVNVPTKDRTGRWARVTFKIVLSYHGGSFDGWQRQPGLTTVQGLVEKALGRFVDEKKAQQLKDRSLPVEGCALVAGRTDKGVTALQQVCSFYTWRKDVKVGDIEDAINNAAPGKIRAISADQVSRVFHPNFLAKWRRYFYIFPLNDGEEDSSNDSKEEGDIFGLYEQNDELETQCDEYAEKDGGCLALNDEDVFNDRKIPRSFSISRVNQLLHQLEGKSLSYKMFARDTKASRSIGPPTECFIFHARAAEARLPCAKEAHMKGMRVMCVELVANRFLRKQGRNRFSTIETDPVQLSASFKISVSVY